MTQTSILIYVPLFPHEQLNVQSNVHLIVIGMDYETKKELHRPIHLFDLIEHGLAHFG